MTTIFCALLKEARGLIKELGLTRRKDAPVYDIYEVDDIRLIITGIGKVQAAAAAGYCTGIFGTDDLYINYGSAAGMVSGTFLAAMIKDESTGCEYFPDISDSSFRHCTLVTSDNPVSKYEILRSSFDMRVGEAPAVYDMEGAAIFAVLKKVVTPDRIIILKTVTDNGNPDFKKTGQILNDCSPAVAGFIRQISLQDSHRTTADDPLTEVLSDELCCSETMHHELSQIIKYMTVSGQRAGLQKHIDFLHEQGLLPALDRRHGKELLARLLPPYK